MDVQNITDKALGEEIARRVDQGGGKLIMQGFGSFKTAQVKERTFRNLQTGAPVVVAPHEKLTFKPSKTR